MSKKLAGLWSFIITVSFGAGFVVGCSGGFETDETESTNPLLYGFSANARLESTTAFSAYTNNDLTIVSALFTPAGDRVIATMGPYDDFIISSLGSSWSWPNYLASGPTLSLVPKEAFYYATKNYVLSNDGTDTYLRSATADTTSYILASPITGFVGNSATSKTGTAVIVGGAGGALKIYSSTNASTWTSRTPGSGGTGTTFNKVIYSGTQFVAVGNNGEIQTSADAITWTRRAPAGGFTGTFASVAFGNNRYVAVGYTAGNAATVQTSIDGITWTAGTSSMSAQIYGVSFYDAVAIFISVGVDGIETSIDGSTWTAGTVGGAYTGIFSGIACVTNYCIAVGEDGEIQRTVNSVLWTEITGPVVMASTVDTKGAAAGSVYELVVGSSGFIESYNGISWSKRTPAGAIATSLNAATYGSPAGFVIVGDGGVIQTSSTGATWTARTAGSGYVGNFAAATYSSSYGVYIAAGAAGGVQTSPDGLTWTAQPVDATNWTGVTASDALVVLVGPGGKIKTSPDLVAWTTQTQAGAYAGSFRGVSYGENIFVAVGDSGEIESSPDGITWTKRTATGLTTANLLATTYNAGYFYAVGAGNTVVRSADGITWSVMTNSDITDNSITCIAGTRNRMVAGLATFGQILTGIAREASTL